MKRFLKRIATVTVAAVLLLFPGCGEDDVKSTYEQTGFYMGASLSFPAMRSNGRRFADMASLLKEANLNLIIPFPAAAFSRDPDGFYGAFEEVGLDMMAVPSSVYSPAEIDREAIAAEVTSLRENYSHIVGFFVWDEPRIDEFEQVRHISQLVTETDPTAATLCCLLPGYDSKYNWYTRDPQLHYTAYIPSFIETVRPNLLTMDYYPFQQYGLGTNMRDNGFWKDIGYLTSCAQQEGIPYWQWISGLHEWTEGRSDQMTMRHMKMQVNGSLVYGVKGIVIFNANQCIITNELEKAEKYDDMAQLNQETINIGNLLFNAERTAVYHSSNYTDPYLDDVSESVLIASIPQKGNGIVVSVFSEGDKTYVVVVNKNHIVGVFGTIELKNTHTVAVFDALENTMGAGVPSDRIDYDLEAGGIQVFRLT